MRILVEGINPQPWRAGKFGKKRVGGKLISILIKDEGTAAYQEGLHEAVTGALAELQVPLPVFPKGTLLRVKFTYWYQIEQFRNLNTGRITTPKQPDTSNLTKATEDALQGLMYHNDKDNRSTWGELVYIGTEEPRVLISVEPWDKFIQLESAMATVDWLKNDSQAIVHNKNVWAR